MDKVKRRRERVYEYILQRIGTGTSPTVREICEDLHIPSTSTVHGDLRFLIDNGYIEMEAGLNRTIRLPGEQNVRVPLLGTVAAGQPILAVQNVERFIPMSFSGSRDKELFALRVQGDSMIKAAILEGDIVVVERGTVANNGEIVVAMVEDEATVKRFYKENGGFRLQAENDDFPPILLDEVEVLGKVVSVIRYYD